MSLLGQVDLNSLLLFAAVAESGGFTAAADRLGVTKAKASIEVQRLEARLGTALFTRTTRRVNLTEAGQALYAECRPLLQGLEQALDRAGSRQAERIGTLRLATSVDYAVQSLAPAVARFAALHPRLNIEVRTSDRMVDLVEEGIDLAIRLGWLKDSSLRAVKLGEFGQQVVASPDYLRRAGHPDRPEDLLPHEWIALTLLPTPLTWQFTAASGETRTVQTRARLRADSPGALRALLREGAGISVLDQFSAREDIESGRLVPLLADWSLPRGGIYAVHPPGRHVPANVRAFVEFYRQHLPRPRP